MNRYVIGLDFGTLSARAVLVDVASGEILGEKVSNYPHGVIQDRLPLDLTAEAVPLGPACALQYPGDYLVSLKEAVTGALDMAGAVADVAAGAVADQVIGVSLDFTCCSLLPVDENLTPLCLLPGFAAEPGAYVKLWKHHSTQRFADKACQVALDRKEPFMARYLNTFSSDWVAPKLMETLAESPAVCEQTAYYLEAGEWLTSLLCGQICKSSSFASFKSLWSLQDGYPSEDYFRAVSPALAKEMKKVTSLPVTRIGERAGTLCEEYARQLGLKPGIPIGIPSGDAYASVAGLSAVRSGDMIMMLGTSSSDLMSWKSPTGTVPAVPGIDAAVTDGILPGMVTFEAGQYATGDMLGWFVKNQVPASYEQEAAGKGLSLHQLLTEKAALLPPGAGGVTVLEWWNGNRSILNNSDLSGSVFGLTLTTRPEQIYRAMMEATAFGQRVILENYARHGVCVDRVILCGGMAASNPLMTQLYADILGRELLLSTVTQSSALGSAMYAAVAAGEEMGGYPDIYTAADAMCFYPKTVIKPEPENARLYDGLYQKYLTLYQAMGHFKF